MLTHIGRYVITVTLLCQLHASAAAKLRVVTTLPDYAYVTQQIGSERVEVSAIARVRSGQSGFVAASDGVELLEKPALLPRQEDGIHIYGNPHITTISTGASSAYGRWERSNPSLAFHLRPSTSLN